MKLADISSLKVAKVVNITADEYFCVRDKPKLAAVEKIDLDFLKVLLYINYQLP